MQAATVIINDRPVEVWVLATDPDQRANLWVFEQDNPDADHLVSRDKVVKFYDKQR